ncbi:MAG: DUF3788 family protein [Candidatus Pseudobacter hemicellulosilyticus]|uniref:DUF3788 family protein n=1 Tax=Candidatus Pseudobacter hemicellulosilyticus TaxID=3121375 RepID=A0AAJ5WUM3_9BACT|nr:MAG: DUF3788 family protein [Pseudobacter sp.]
MSPSTLVFTDKTQAPATAALGKKQVLLDSLLRENKITETIWKYYSASSGWTLQCREKKQNLFYIQVTSTGFDVWFTLGKAAKGKALAAIADPLLIASIQTAAEYREGTSFKVSIQTTKDLPVVRLLTEIRRSK